MQIRTLHDVGTQLAIRNAWEHTTTGSVSKLVAEMTNSYAKKMKEKATLRINDLAIGHILKRMNLETMPKDAMKALFALDHADKFWPEEAEGIYKDPAISFEEKAEKLAEEAWDKAEDYGLEPYEY